MQARTHILWQDRKINTDHRASCFGPITPLWCRLRGDSWQATLSHSHASQNNWWIPLFLLPIPPFLTHYLPAFPSISLYLTPLLLWKGPRWWEWHRTEGVFMKMWYPHIRSPFANPWVMVRRDRLRDPIEAGEPNADDERTLRERFVFQLGKELTLKSSNNPWEAVLKYISCMDYSFYKTKVTKVMRCNTYIYLKKNMIFYFESIIVPQSNIIIVVA